jgi:hypothetical protein
VVGELLLTAIAVLAFAVVITFVLSQVGNTESARVDVNARADIDTDTVYFRHVGGETLDSSDIELLININGTSRRIYSSQFSSSHNSSVWEFGDIIAVNVSDMFDYDITENSALQTKLIRSSANLVFFDAQLRGTQSYFPSSLSSSSGGGQSPTIEELGLAKWPFEAGSGSVAYDSFGSNNGTIYGATWATGINGSALLLRGKSDYVEINNPIVADYPFTISAWINTSSSDQRIVSLADGSSKIYYYDLYIDASGYPVLESTNTESRIVTGNINIADGKWHHIVGVFAENERHLYVDGTQNGSDSRNSPLSFSVDRWQIGSWAIKNGMAYFDGYIDEVYLTDEALNSTEIQQLYSSIASP